MSERSRSAAYHGVVARCFSCYRGLLSPVFASSGLGNCRYLPTCSEYAHIALIRYGAWRGTVLAMARLLRCHPWAEGGLDPVPPLEGEMPPGRDPATREKAKRLP